jgi:hypothetical protein
MIQLERLIVRGSMAAFAAGLVLACMTATAQTDQTAQPQLPPRPYVGALSGDYVFTKKFVYKQQQEDPNQSQQQKDLLKFLSRFPIPEEVESKESGSLREDKRSNKNGLVIDVWRVGNFRLSQYSTSPNSIDVVPYVPGQGMDAPDFPELDWVNEKSYQGEQQYAGKPCYFYKLDDQSAWIDKATKLPVYYESKAQQVTYTYRQPDETLQLPDKFAQRLRAVQPH